MIDNITKEAIRLTRKFVKIPSESSEPVGAASSFPEAGIVAELEELCSAHNISWKLQKVAQGRSNFIASFPKPDAVKILFLAHMDTVSAKGMKSPFSGDLYDNKIWGRGSCDDKGSLATIFSVLIGLKEQGRPLKYDVTVVATVDEECGMAGSAKFFQAYPAGWDLCVALEPSLLQPISAHIGVYRCRILLDGSTQKSSMRQLGAESGKEIMNSIRQDLRAFEQKICKESDPRLGSTVVNITQFGGVGDSDKMAGPCRFLVDIRFLPQQTPAEIHAEILKVVGDRGKVIPLFAALGIDSDPDNNFIKLFQESIARCGFCADLTAVPYPSDCSQLRSRCAALVWGPGNPAQAHKNDEYIEVGQLLNGCQILSDFFTDPGII
jgi:acetylornithine deacetylase/succinyl-diaminopimelate desuccinylase-like protein